MFKDQIGRNVKEYVDSMVIKSQNDHMLLKDIEETLKTLEKVCMKLNPTKCTFGVQEGKFLGHYITKEEFQPIPKKVVELLDTTESRSLKEMQALNGKIMAMGQFIARSTYKVILLFQMLKGCVDKCNFHWNREA